MPERRSWRNLAVLVAASLAAAAIVSRRDVTGTVHRITGATSEPPVLEVSSGVPESGYAAVLVHGFQCNHSMMIPVARALADRGIRTFVTDLPGHGSSAAGWSDEASVSAAARAVDLVVDETRLPRDRILLVGHSYGASVLTPVLAAHPEHPAVFIGPSYRKGLSSKVRSLTVITASGDDASIVEAARTYAAETASSGPVHPSSVSPHARGRVIDDVGHVGLLLDARTHAAVLDAASGPDRLDAPVRSPASFRLTGVLLTFVLGVAAAARTAARSHHRPGGVLRAWGIPLVLAYSVLVGAAVTRRWGPLSFVSLLEGDQIAGFVFAAGCAAVLSGRVVFGAWPLPSASALLHGGAVGVAVWALLYSAAALAVSPALYHVTFDGSQRLEAAAAMAIAFYPAFGFAEAVSSRLERMRSMHVLAWACRLAFPVATALVLPLLAPRLGRFSLAVLVMGVCCSAYGAVLSRASRNTSAGAVFAALTCSWIISVGFIRI